MIQYKLETAIERNTILNDMVGMRVSMTRLEAVSIPATKT